MIESALSSAVQGKGAGIIAAVSGVAVFPLFLAADTLPERLTWGGGLVLAAGFTGRLFSKYFDSRASIIAAHSAQATQAAQTAEEQNAALVQRMVDAHARECSAYEKQIERLSKDVDYNRARAEKAESRADTAEQISASASKSKHDVLTALQSAESWIKNAQEEFKEKEIPLPYNYTFANWETFFKQHDEAAAKLLSERQQTKIEPE